MKDAISGRDKLDFRNLDLGSTCARVFLRSSVVYLQVYCRRPAWNGDADYQSRNYCSNSQKLVKYLLNIAIASSHLVEALCPLLGRQLRLVFPLARPQICHRPHQFGLLKGKRYHNNPIKTKNWGDHEAGAGIFPTETLGDALAQSCVVALID